MEKSKRKLKVFEAFAGIGAQASALKRLNIEYEIVGISDWFIDAIKCYAAIHCKDRQVEVPEDKAKLLEYLSKFTFSADSVRPTDLRRLSEDDLRDLYRANKQSNNYGSISEIDPAEMPETDLLVYSFPCQDLSTGGLGKGMKKGSGTRSGLLWEIERILLGLKSLNRLPEYLLLENVKTIKASSNIEDLNQWLEFLSSIDKLKTAFNSAKENPAEENLFRQLRLNQWVKQNVRWMPMDAWDKCDFAVNAEKLLGRECYGGLDLSSSTDITAFVLVFPPTADDDKYSILPFFWIPEDTIDLRVRRDHVPYDTWLGRGQVIATEGNVIHYGYIENFIEDLGTKYHIKEIAFDRWGAVQMVQNLEGMGFTVVPFGQGFKDMSPPTKELMKLVLEQKIAHGGNVPLRWMMDNVYVRTDPAGNIKMDKEKSTERIDGAVATVMALDRAIRNEGSTDSVYNERGIIVI